MQERPDPFRSISRAVLAVLAEEGRPMSLRELEQDERLTGAEPARQLAVARMAGFVRPAVAGAGPGLEPVYQPTALGLQIARRSEHLARPAA